tara:strand:- start:6504 stop:8255 length:1752 start_codon:yes stop_codon:yes gene_type:complete
LNVESITICRDVVIEFRLSDRESNPNQQHEKISLTMGGKRLFLIIAMTCSLLRVPLADCADHAPIQTKGEVRDVILMLEPGPLHLRLHIALGGQSLPAIREAYVDRLMQTLDQDEDGKLSQEEMTRSPLLRTPQRPLAASFLKSLGTAQTFTRSDIMRTVERVGGETIAYREDTTSVNNDQELFNFLDQDSSGQLDRMELVAAARRVLEKDLDRDEVVSFEELLPEPVVDPSDPIAGLGVVTPRRPSAGISTMIRDTRETRLSLRLLRQYDANRDRKLSQSELAWDDASFRFMDTSGDGLLDEVELGFIHQSPVDLELAIDLEPVDDTIPAVQVIHANGKRIERTMRPDFAKIQFEGAIVSFTRRKIDPIATAVDNAMIEFNNMDIDVNGYLEKEETEQRVRFARGLFQTIDFDGDGRISGEEMEEYVRVRSEPLATSCRVNIFDTGHGFFMALDSSGDGRIGFRERRDSAKTLAMLDRDGQSGVSMEEPVRHFHVEFVRGAYRLFGANDESADETPAFQQRSESGPTWFRRMDRNGDGDLVWGEFLGPRDVFHQLDADHDGLIDPVEATAAENSQNNETSGP